MATWFWIFPRSIPAIAAQATFSLLFLLAVPAPSLPSVALDTRLKGAESAVTGVNVVFAEATDTSSTAPSTTGTLPTSGQASSDSGTSQAGNSQVPTHNGSREPPKEATAAPNGKGPTNGNGKSGLVPPLATLTVALCASMITGS